MTEKEFLRAVKGADRRFFKMAADRAADPQAFAAKYGAGGTRKMKSAEKKHHKKLAWGVVLAAALVGGGGIAAAVAMRGDFGIVSEESRDMRSMVEEQHAEALSLNLTDQQWNAMQSDSYGSTGYGCAFPTENGWYHSYDETAAPSDGELGEEFFEAQEELYPTKLYLENLPLMFCDGETGEDVPLCARPNCLHDGSIYCEATSNTYRRSDPVCVDGVIYASALKTLNFDELKSDGTVPKKTTAVLLSYAPDDTGITELCTFGEQYTDVICTPVVHRGYVFCIFMKINPLEYDAAGFVTKSDSGYAILGYEIATGKATEIYSCMPKAGSGIKQDAPWTFSAGGDYLFYSIGNVKWQNINKQGIYALNLTDGSHKQLVDKEAVFAVSGSKVYYTDFDATPNKVKSTDAATGETETLYNGSLSYSVTDGTCIYSAEADYSREVMSYFVRVLDMTGKEVASLRVPDHQCVRRIMVFGDTVAVITDAVIAEYQGQIQETSAIIAKDAAVLSCSREALLAGSAEWEQACTLMKMHEIDMEAWRAEHPETEE